MDRFLLFAFVLAAIPIISSSGHEDLARSAVLLAFILVGAVALHIYNQKRVHDKIESLEHCHVSKESFYREITIAQGSNFCALAFAAWLMLFVAIAYLYFLVPIILPFSYMQIPDLASSPFGFSIFGLKIAIIAALVILALDKLPESHRELKLTELYSFYTITKRAKKLIALTIPALSISIVCSAYLGTIYPEHSLIGESLALILLVLSAGTLVAPIYKDAVEGLR
jgi:hypothetical protein